MTDDTEKFRPEPAEGDRPTIERELKRADPREDAGRPQHALRSCWSKWVIALNYPRCRLSGPYRPLSYRLELVVHDGVGL
jgi:hypothetical protein